MNETIRELVNNGPVVTDGSWGTQLHLRGLSLGENPDAWNLSHPDLVEEVAQQYVDAGSQVVLTNTFGANRLILEKSDLADEVEAINMAGVEISKRAAGDRALVFASIGPSGKMLITQETTEEELASVFTDQARALSRAGADALVIETMMDINEACIAASAAKETGLPVIANMVYDAGKDKDRTMMGNTPEQVAEALEKIGIDGIGANCGQGIEGFIPICKRLRAVTDLPLWMKPNAGLPEMVDGETVFKTTADEFIGQVPELIRSGASFIGGCCGTDQSFVRKIRETIRS
ncbi:MAG: homocysteine S-methyltransferase family protein [Desulfobacterales bacterium]